MNPERFWRIRGRDATGTDRVAEAWSRGEVGVWYGAWTADDWYAAISKSAADPAAYLNALPRQAALQWRGGVPKSYVDTARRFAGIEITDWLVTCHSGSIHLGRVDGPMRSSETHPLNCGQEVFKYRRALESKRFRLGQLPDPYRLLPSAGRGNVHEFHGTNRRLVEILSRVTSERDVAAELQCMSSEDWLDVLGPGEWESLCLGYLIKTEAFLPTGLMVGRTLPAFDIIGVSSHTHQKILAQCKKDPVVVNVDRAFLQACEDVKTDAAVFYFAYSGCRDAPSWVRVVTRHDMSAWLSNGTGAEYLALWRGQGKP